MTDENKPQLPSTSRELAAYRKHVAQKNILNRVDDLLMKNWGKDPKLHAVLQTRALNGSTVEGTLVADKVAGAMYLREKAAAAGESEIAALPLAELSNKIGAVLRRFDLDQLKLEGQAHAVAEAEYGGEE